MTHKEANNYLKLAHAAFVNAEYTPYQHMDREIREAIKGPMLLIEKVCLLRDIAEMLTRSDLPSVRRLAAKISKAVEPAQPQDH